MLAAVTASVAGGASMPGVPPEREVLLGGLCSLTRYLAGNAAGVRFVAAIEDTRLEPALDGASGPGSRGLESAGLVRRVPSDADARSLLVELTPSGRKRAELAFRADLALERSLLRSLTTDERNQLGQLLAKLGMQLAKVADSEG